MTAVHGAVSSMMAYQNQKDEEAKAKENATKVEVEHLLTFSKEQLIQEIFDLKEMAEKGYAEAYRFIEKERGETLKFKNKFEACKKAVHHYLAKLDKDALINDFIKIEENGNES